MYALAHTHIQTGKHANAFTHPHAHLHALTQRRYTYTATTHPQIHAYKLKVYTRSHT